VVPAALQTSAKFRWTPAKSRAAVLLAEDDRSDVEIAAELGVAVSTLWRWGQHPEFAATVGDHVGKLQAAMLRYPIAKRRERIRVLNSLHEKQLAVIAARAAEMAGACPGGETGLMVRQIKAVNTGRGPTAIEEFAVDTGLLREIRATEEQAAKELGQWVEKSEAAVGLTGAVRLIGVDPEDV
jgi:hypothetical protein